MKMKVTLISALLAVWTVTARADLVTGQMLEDLFESKDAGDLMMATGYVGGVIDMSLDTAQNKLYCAHGVTLKQLAAVVQKHLADNPASWHKNGKVLVLEAIAKAFPCKK
jgi:hypothetical protein